MIMYVHITIVTVIVTEVAIFEYKYFGDAGHCVGIMIIQCC